MKRINWKKRRRWEDRMTILWAVFGVLLLILVLIIMIDPQLLYMVSAHPRAPTR